jgi:hypothetical protein
MENYYLPCLMVMEKMELKLNKDIPFISLGIMSKLNGLQLNPKHYFFLCSLFFFNHYKGTKNLVCTDFNKSESEHFQKLSLKSWNKVNLFSCSNW